MATSRRPISHGLSGSSQRSTAVRVCVGGSVSGSDQREAACEFVGGPRIAFRLPHAAHELAHAHALAHATRGPACQEARNFPRNRSEVLEPEYGP